MDPLTIIGTASSITSIVEVICKTVKALRELHERWKDVDLTILNLISQLNALKAALNKIGEWIAEDLADIPQHHQLVLDLEDSITCCRMLMKSMDNEISKLNIGADDALDFGSKLRVVLDDKASKDFQKFIERQVSALNLLLTACNCKTSSEQKKLLEKSSSRKVLDQIKDDSSSLFVLCDTSSLFSERTYTTDNSSKISRIFQFDSELKNTKLYQAAAWSNYRKAFQRRIKRDDESSHSRSTTLKLGVSALFNSANDLDVESLSRSKDIDSSLEQDRQKLRGECKILLMDGCRSGNGSDTLLKMMKIDWGAGFNREELQSYHDQMVRSVFEGAQSFARWWLYANPDSEDDLALTKVTTILGLSKSDQTLKPELVSALKLLWHRHTQRSGSLDEPQFIEDSLVYFFNKIERIADPLYTPTEEDILQLSPKLGQPRPVVEGIFSIGNLDMHVINVNGIQSGRRKWMHQFEDPLVLVFTVDLCWYDVTDDWGDDSILAKNTTKLKASLARFGYIANSLLFRRSTIILFLTNFQQFKVKINSSPIEIYFPDYSGSSWDADAAATYILGLFKDLDRAPLGIQHYFTEPMETLNARCLLALVQDAIINRNLWSI